MDLSVGDTEMCVKQHATTRKDPQKCKRRQSLHNEHSRILLLLIVDQVVWDNQSEATKVILIWVTEDSECKNSG